MNKMVNSLLIGKKIYKILSTDNELNTLVKGQIYPLLANKSTTYPFIVYSRDNVTPSYCKDGNYEDVVGVSIVVVSDSYEEGVDIANVVRSDLELLTYEDDNIYIAYSELEGVDEYTQDDAYVQKLRFKIIIQN